ncbi:MAG: TIGR01457 family HAD-type hydrolase [Aquificota bacterium]|nr:MAG: TIGR01457 family HAD-type hydrolase [Aquificota bacterium]
MEERVFSLDDIRLFAVDLDGVVYRGNIMLPGASSFISRIRELDRPLVFVTNSTLRPRGYYAAKLKAMGIPVAPQEIITAAYATGRYLMRIFNGASPTVFLLGERGLEEELEDLEPRYLTFQDQEVAQAVVVGLDRKVNYEKLCKAVRDVMEGALFIGVNGDPLWPVEEGFMPGVGVFLAAIETATGVKPFIVGKPNTYMLELAIQLYGCEPSQVLMVGDKLDSDIMMGRRLGAKTALVLSGVTPPGELEKAPPKMEPHVVARDLAHLEELLFHSE